MPKPLIEDDLWVRIEPLLPKKRRRKRYTGRRPLEDRLVLSGILFVLRSGIPWEMLPKEMGCGSGMTCWRRLKEWQRRGVWRRLHKVLLSELRGAEKLDFSRAVADSSSIRAVGAGKKWTEPNRSPSSGQQTSHTHGCARCPAFVDPDRGQPTRCDSVAAFGSGNPAGRGTAWRTAAQACPDSGGPCVSFRAAASKLGAKGNRNRNCPTRNASWQRLGQDALGSRTHYRLAASIPSPARALRASAFDP